MFKTLSFVTSNIRIIVLLSLLNILSEVLFTSATTKMYLNYLLNLTYEIYLNVSYTISI